MRAILSELEVECGGCAATEGHLVIFDRTADKPWNDKVFCRTENAAGVPITVWGM